MDLPELLNQISTTKIYRDIESEQEIVLCLNDNFLKLPEGIIMTDENEFDKLAEMWMYDDFCISQLPRDSNCSLENLLKINLFLSSPKNSRKFEQYENVQVKIQEISQSDFKDFFSWGIYEVFLEELNIELTIDSNIGQQFFRLMDRDNPMILAMKTNEATYLFNYSGYI
ncbi:MAG: hypothetical protein EP338_10035 [Bacteroidetes bacterium]|nr:MAG: hypothetical protein EP338_10035 [Bacteroidota bacterium]